jgi:cytochrome oxidase assembly protein ShyY1
MWKSGRPSIAAILPAHRADTVTGSMYRFLLRPTWIGFHLLVVGAIVAMVSLGFWQLRRLDERQAFNAQVESRYDTAPVPIDDLLVPGFDADAVEWRPVTATGTYVPDETVRIVNRSQNGFAGDNVVVPLDLGDGRLLLVNRGFLPLGIDVPPAPEGTVTVTGRLRPSQERRTGQLSDPAEGDLAEAQRLDIERLAPQFDGAVVGMYVDVFESRPADSDSLQPVLQPDLSEGPHLSYAVQWFVFSIAVAIGWVLAVRKSLRSRRREAAQDARAVPDVGTVGR